MTKAQSPPPQTVHAADPIPEVALLFGRSTSWGQGIIRGIMQYAQQHGPWRFLVDSVGTSSYSPDEPDLPLDWQGHGVIGNIKTQSLSKLQHVHCPMVNIAAPWGNTPPELPHVITDYVAALDMAVQHMLDRGFRQFVYVERPSDQANEAWVKDRVAGAGGECWTFDIHALHALDPASKQRTLAEWLKQLPAPVALVCVSDAAGYLLIQTCATWQIRVPEEVAIISIGRDQLLCEISQPQLTYVKLATERQGYRAAAALDRLMHGQPLESQIEYIPPLRVVSRRSTDTLAIADPDVAEVLHFIQQHAPKGLTVKQILARFPFSRWWLEQQFRQCLGRSPAEEIRRVRIAHLKHLLQTSEMTILEIAEAAGFENTEYMSTYFRRDVGMTPRAYRRKSRSR
ncbi:MAG: substrate-binding domain-containing protein [bacterium]